MSLFGKRSLGTKFLLSLTIGALVMTLLGALATFHITSQQLQSQLVQRGKLLASAINHSAMIATSEEQFAHVAREVMRDNPEVTGVVILSQDGKRTIFEEHLDPQSVSRETSEQLKAEARHALSTGTFGFRPSDSNQLKIVVPLTTPLGSHTSRGMRTESTAENAHGNAAKAAEGTHETGHMKSDNDHVASTMPQHKQMIMPGSASDTPAEPKSDFMAPTNQAMSMGTYGAVLMTFDRNSIEQSLNAILWRLMPTSLFGMIMTLALCYLLLRHQVLKPIVGIRSAMALQQAGQRDARAEQQSSIEIDDVASTLNRMLDTLEDREEELNSRVVELETAHEQLEAQASDLRDLTDDLGQAKELLNDAVESISEGFALWDGNDILIMCNNRYKNLYPDISEVIVPGASFTDFARAAYQRGIFSLDGDDLAAAIQERVVRHQTSVSAFEQELGDGRWVRVSKRKTKSGHTVSILSDITDRVESEATIRRMALEDPLTGLSNRAQFQEQLQSALLQADRTSQKVGVMLLDLDHFKNVNDTLGHAAGDELLKQVAVRIHDCLRETDLVARLGGDEFAVITTNVQQSDGVYLVGQRIVEALAEPFLVDGKEIHTGASIGITIYPEDKGDQGHLLRNADLALYKAKEDGRGVCRLFDEQLHFEIQARSVMEQDLRRAIAQNQFHMVYQPQIDLRSGEIIGAESLIRWNHPERGLVSPAEFIPVAESTQQILGISQWVIRQVCRQFASWIEDGMELPSVSINISPLHFRQEGLVDQIGSALSESGLEAQRLEIEITEGMAMTAGDNAVRTLESLKTMGVRLAIDDFGTGYSSLSRLKEFPVDRLKIDQSFIRNVPDNEDDSAITSAVIQLGHTLNLKVIAEAVETREQLEFLSAQGCDEVQGYYFSRPLSVEDFVAFVASYQPKPTVVPENVDEQQRKPPVVRKQA